jgi:hypothetical protein
VLPDGREVKRVVDTERIVASGTETSAGETGHGVSSVLLWSFVLAAFCLLALWYFFFT